MKLNSLSVLGLVAAASIAISQPAHAEQRVSLEQAIVIAQQNDPWLQGSRLKQDAVEHRSVAVGALPDPSINVALMNMPSDSFEFDQEGMTQFKVGVSQMFPRGDTRAIKARQLQIDASKFPLLRQDRKAKIRAQVTERWLDAYSAQKTIALIESNRSLFEQMAEIAKANYSNTVGKTRQQDVIRAQLELVQLKDRLTAEKQKLHTAHAQLNEWLLDDYVVDSALPVISMPKWVGATAQPYSRNDLGLELANHPRIMAVELKRQRFEKGVELEKQQYKPQWGVNASYGYRGDMPSGADRADLLSIGVTFDLPVFTKNRQDRKVQASVAEVEAVKTEKLLLTKQMIGSLEKEFATLNGLSERQSIYKRQLLQQFHQQAEAALTAYTNDDGSFSEVVRARIAELNARISALHIDVDTLKTKARINYFFVDETTEQLVGER